MLKKHNPNFDGDWDPEAARIIIERLNKKWRGDERVHEYTTELDGIALRMLRREIAKVRAARAAESG